MKKKYLRRVSAGLYASLQGQLYLDLREFMAACGIPDNPEARQSVLAQLSQAFGDAGVEILEDTD